MKCWFCGESRPPKGKCQGCRAPPKMPEGWTGHTFKNPIGEGNHLAAPKQTIDGKDGDSKKKKKDSRHTTIWIRKTTRMKIRKLRNRLPYSAVCKTDDDLLSRLIEKEDH